MGRKSNKKKAKKNLQMPTVGESPTATPARNVQTTPKKKSPKKTKPPKVLRKQEATKTEPTGSTSSDNQTPRSSPPSSMEEEMTCLQSRMNRLTISGGNARMQQQQQQPEEPTGDEAAALPPRQPEPSSSQQAEASSPPQPELATPPRPEPSTPPKSEGSTPQKPEPITPRQLVLPTLEEAEEMIKQMPKVVVIHQKPQERVQPLKIPNPAYKHAPKYTGAIPKVKKSPTLRESQLTACVFTSKGGSKDEPIESSVWVPSSTQRTPPLPKQTGQSSSRSRPLRMRGIPSTSTTSPPGVSPPAETGETSRVPVIPPLTDEAHGETTPPKRTRVGSPVRERRSRRRFNFNDAETEILEKAFDENMHPSLAERKLLASKVKQPEESIKFWFQNRRQLEKRFETVDCIRLD